MAVKCTICWAWQPKEWDGSKGHWSDTVAFCQIKGKYTCDNETCLEGKIVRPAYGQVKAPLKKEPVAKQPQMVTNTGPTITGELYGHQKEAFERFKNEKEIALFMEMGTGKTATVLRIAGHKFKKGDIDGLLVVAPNDVHVQWAHEQIPLWLDCPYNIQCLFGRGGQKVAYPFDDDPDYLQVVCVNIDTFSTPSKWQDIVDWHNTRKCMVVLDEATVIKSVSSKRTERMLYAFNDVTYRKKTVLKSVPKSVARAILTGTPVTNGPMDMWAMMEFLRPNYFNRNWYSFQAHFGMFITMAVNDRPIKVPLSEEWWHVIKGIGRIPLHTAASKIALTESKAREICA
jgi:hypothetical protein